MCPTAIPKRSIVALLPSITEKEKRTQGRNGAVNGKRPRKLIRTIGFLCPQIYTIIKVKEEPKNCTFTKGATICVYVCVCVLSQHGCMLSQQREKTYRHDRSSHEQHEQEICGSTSEMSVLQQSRVSD